MALFKIQWDHAVLNHSQKCFHLFQLITSLLWLKLDKDFAGNRSFSQHPCLVCSNRKSIGEKLFQAFINGSWVVAYWNNTAEQRQSCRLLITRVLCLLQHSSMSSMKRVYDSTTVNKKEGGSCPFPAGAAEVTPDFHLSVVSDDIFGSYLNAATCELQYPAHQDDWFL